MTTLLSIELWIESLFIILYCLTIFGLITVVIIENRNPVKSVAWIAVLLMLPFLGILFYFFFGQDNRKQRIVSHRSYRRIMKGAYKQQIGKVPYSLPNGNSPLAKLIDQMGSSPLLHGSDIRTFTDGQTKMECLLEDIRSAKEFIHLEYYIFTDDEVGKTMKDALIAKAQEGVQVRVIYDDVGSWGTKKQFFGEMQQAGIEVYAFLPVFFPRFTSKVNYRNHRKIVVIDGTIGYLGGMNIANRYVKGLDWGCWKDLHFRLMGEGVHGLQMAFLVDWYVVSQEIIEGKKFYPKPTIYNDNALQVATSGPTGLWRTLLQATIHLVANAKQYIYIQTPYFIPTEGLNQVLQTAALSGVDVRIMLPQRSDTKMANWASHSFIEEMLRAGVAVYFYKPGFLHSKLIITDDTVSCIGSANMDFRSLEHNFEITAYVYDENLTKSLCKQFLSDCEACEKPSFASWRRRPFRDRLRESFMRLFSPLL